MIALKILATFYLLSDANFLLLKHCVFMHFGDAPDPGKQQRMAQDDRHCKHVGDPEQAPESWLQISLASAVKTIS